MSKADVEKWRAEAMALPTGEFKTGVPFDTFLGEAIDVAKFHANRWKAVRGTDDHVVFPGLEMSVGAKGKSKKPLSAKTGEEIRSLHDAVQTADTDYVFAQSKGSPAPMVEARACLSYLDRHLTWLFDDGVEDENDTKLANLEERYDQPTTTDKMAAALRSFTALAEENAAELGNFETWIPAKIAEAKALVTRLEEAPAAGHATPKKEATVALDLRDRLARLLQAKIRLVRGAANFVFADHPETRKEATSAFERRKRSASRRAAAEEAAKEPVPPKDPPK